jgi:hypothetical protein
MIEQLVSFFKKDVIFIRKQYEIADSRFINSSKAFRDLITDNDEVLHCKMDGCPLTEL